MEQAFSTSHFIQNNIQSQARTEERQCSSLFGIHLCSLGMGIIDAM
jgi:hypothetical protein